MVPTFWILVASRLDPAVTPFRSRTKLARVLPVVEALHRRHPAMPISVDTVKAEVAAAVLGAGAAIINDVSAFRLDPAMAGIVARGKAGAILMHSRGTVSTMARLDHADYSPDLVTEVRRELSEAMDAALTAGVPAERMVLDPGFGFAKNAEQNLLLLDQLAALRGTGAPSAGRTVAQALPGERHRPGSGGSRCGDRRRLRARL